MAISCMLPHALVSRAVLGAKDEASWCYTEVQCLDKERLLLKMTMMVVAWQPQALIRYYAES